MCSSKPKAQKLPPLPPPPQPAREPSRAYGTEESRAASRRRIYAGIFTTPRGVLQAANLGVPLLGGGMAPAGG